MFFSTIYLYEMLSQGKYFSSGAFYNTSTLNNIYRMLFLTNTAFVANNGLIDVFVLEILNAKNI